MSSTSIYAARQLKPGVRQCRLLLLQPASEGYHDEIRAKLVVANLDDEKGKFDTLSYLWGDPKASKTTIFIENIPFPITRGLGSFLRHIRSLNRNMPVWADAICINQDDLDEKSEQVLLMKDIYRFCSRVNVWLPDPEAKVSPTGSNLELPSLGGLMQLIGDGHFHDLPGYTLDPQTRKLSFDESAQFRALWTGYDLLVSSRWWTRAWTAQEAFLPPELVFLHNEAQSCTMSTIMHGLNHLWKQTMNPQSCCQVAMDLFPPFKLASLWGLFNRMMKIQDRKTRMHRDPDDTDCFYILFNKFADRQCQYGRDRVYSLWSQTDETYKHLVPDYTSADGEVYTSVFKGMVREAQTHPRDVHGSGMDCRVFQILGFDGMGMSSNRRPSWAPDLGRSWDPEVVVGHNDRLVYSLLYQTSGWTTGQGTIEGHQLRFRGFRIARIRSIGPGPIDKNDVQSIKTAIDALMQSLHNRHAPQNENDGYHHEELSSVLCAEVHHARMSDADWNVWKKRFIYRGRAQGGVGDERLRHEIRYRQSANFQLWRRHKPQDSPSQDNLAKFVATGDIGNFPDPNYRMAVAQSLSQRAFYLTDDDRIGLCPAHAEVGDDIWGIHGSKVPFVFRPVGGEEEQRTFAMVGACYLNGVMDGGGAEERNSVLISIV